MKINFRPVNIVAENFMVKAGFINCKSKKYKYGQNQLPVLLMIHFFENG